MSAAFGKCFDPTGARHGIPTFPWRLRPGRLRHPPAATGAGLRPGGQPIAAQVLRPRCRRGPLVAYLYRVDLAKPVRPMTPGKWAALAKAKLARRTCPACRRTPDTSSRPRSACACPAPTPTPCRLTCGSA